MRRWLEARSADWLAVGDRLERLRGSRRVGVGEALTLVQDYRRIAGDWSMASQAGATATTRAHLARLYAQLHDTLHRPPRRLRMQLSRLVGVEVPAAMRELRAPLAGVTAWFLLSMAAGWVLVSTHPELAALFASETMIDSVQHGELWTDDLLNVVPSSVLSIGIFTNNIAVSLFACCIGVFYGLGTLYIIGVNGLMIGAAFAFTGRYGMDGRLFEFVIAHGVVELSVICISGAVGVTLGQALVSPGQRSRRDAFELAARRAGTVMLVMIAFLVGAGLIEGYVSPDPSYPFFSRFVIGVGYAFLLAVVLSGAASRSRGRGLPYPGAS
jgi:uncharacterized membrane protein SpoIIM required for sporulation